MFEKYTLTEHIDIKTDMKEERESLTGLTIANGCWNVGVVVKAYQNE